MTIWIFNHYAQGPNLPGGTRHYDIAKELTDRGHSVTIFASGFHYSLLKHSVEYNNKGYLIEDINGVKFIWVKTTAYKKNNIFRMLNIVSYFFKIRSVLPKLNLNKPDVIIGSTVHPFAPLIASRFAQQYNVPFIFEIRDLWPQTFIDMGIWTNNSIKSRLFKAIEYLTVSKADRIIILSPLTLNYLAEEYAYPQKDILLLPNGVNEKFIQKSRQSINLPISITYVGGIDSVHGLDFLIDLADALRSEDIIFNIYGNGKEKTRLLTLSEKKNLSNIIWHDSIPKDEVPSKLSEANLLLLSTANVLYGSENKLYEYMASAKPIIFATSGMHNNPLDEVKCGLAIDKDDISQSAHKIKEFIAKQSEQFDILGMNGQRYVLEYRTIKVLVNKLESFLKGIM